MIDSEKLSSDSKTQLLVQAFPGAKTAESGAMSKLKKRCAESYKGICCGNGGVPQATNEVATAKGSCSELFNCENGLVLTTLFLSKLPEESDSSETLAMWSW